MNEVDKQLKDIKRVILNLTDAQYKYIRACLGVCYEKGYLDQLKESLNEDLH